MESVFSGVVAALSWQVLLTALIGVVIGIIVGAMPGLGAIVLIALLLPFLTMMDPTLAIVLCACAYLADTYGGAITAILVNTPGTPSAAATTFDGYPLAQQGKASEALGIAAVSSAMGGLFSLLVLLLAAPLLARVAYHFGPPEYLCLTVFGLTMIASISAASPLRGITAGLFGVLLSMVGVDITSATERFTLGIPSLMEGIDFGPFMIGLFAISELLVQASRSAGLPVLAGSAPSGLPSLKTVRKVLPTIAGSSILGTFIGILPAAGSTIASFVAYSETRRWSKPPKRFGEGDIRGVAAAEAANNSAAGGSFVPTLALGIPGSGTAAMILGIMIMVGLRPGPLLFQEQPQFLGTLFAALLIANFGFLAAGLFGARYFARFATIRPAYLWPCIFVLCVIGTYSLNASWLDVGVMLIFGIVGFAMRLMKYPLAAIAMGLILGELFEQSLLQTLIIFDGDFALLLGRPIAMTLLIVAVATLLWSLFAIAGDRRRAGTAIDEA